MAESRPQEAAAEQAKKMGIPPGGEGGTIFWPLGSHSNRFTGG